MIPISKPLIGEDEKELVKGVLDSGILAQGPRVKEFEQDFSEYIGCNHAIAVSSGTTALHLALLANGIGKEDEVITSPFSFIATANSILYTGAKPVFVDIEEETFNIDPGGIEARITDRTKALLPVHLYGNPAKMKEIMEIAETHDLVVVEDACQAHGAEYLGKKVGGFGTGCFSFYPTKNMTTGEGGIITTDNEEVGNLARCLREHGCKKRYVHDILGFNFRMTDIGAAIGIAQLKKLDHFNEKRIENAMYLSRGLEDVEGILVPEIDEGCKHVFHQYTIRVTGDFKVSRDEVINILNENGIGTGVYYQIPIHKQPLYLEMGYTDSLPEAERLGEEVISLPVGPSVTRENLDKILEVIDDIQ